MQTSINKETTVPPGVDEDSVDCFGRDAYLFGLNRGLAAQRNQSTEPVGAEALAESLYEQAVQNFLCEGDKSKGVALIRAALLKAAQPAPVRADASKAVTCPTCGGSGYMGGTVYHRAFTKCPKCGGAGWQPAASAPEKGLSPAQSAEPDAKNSGEFAKRSVTDIPPAERTWDDWVEHATGQRPDAKLNETKT